MDFCFSLVVGARHQKKEQERERKKSLEIPAIITKQLPSRI